MSRPALSQTTDPHAHKRFNALGTENRAGPLVRALAPTPSAIEPLPFSRASRD